MVSKKHLKIQGARIRSELNDLKRTPEAAAVELKMNAEKLNNVINGKESPEEVNSLITKMGEVYPIDQSDLFLSEDDCTNGVRIMREGESLTSSRIFSRKNSKGERTPYYDYRDTAMSKLGPFKPEWIKELRVVDNKDPENPDVAYNNGHFLHQATFFIGPVNFYHEVNGEKICTEMNTGDSNYITPFHKHSFTNRDPEKDALIIAVTFGGDVRRAQKELYSLGEEGVKKATLPYRDSEKIFGQLVQQHMRNERMSVSNLEEKLRAKGLPLSTDLISLLQGAHAPNPTDLKNLSKVLHVEPSDLVMPIYNSEEEVVVKHKSHLQTSFYPDSQTKLYKINPLARTSKMPSMKGSDIEVLASTSDMQHAFESSLHAYAYNYGDAPVNLNWEWRGENHSDTLNPGDSMYMKPFVKHAFANATGENSKLFTIEVAGALNLPTQKELSYFSDGGRVANETKQWFD